MSKNVLGIFDGYDIEGITALVESLEKSSFDFLKLEGDGMAITIGKNGAGEATAAVQPAAPIAVTAAPAVNATPVAAAVEAPAATIAAAPAAEVVEADDIVIIRSPSYGIFYAQSEPGAPPYVKLGAAVKTGDTVGLLEIMKTFNAVTSPADGEVIAIHIQNAEMLEPDQPLLSIRVK